MRNKKFDFIKELFGLTIGSLIMSIGINMFLAPHTIAPGGLSGASVILNKITGIPVSTVMLLIGVPLVFICIKILGLKNSIRTLLGTVIFSVMIKLTSPLAQVVATEDLLLSSISGGILVGAGIGIVFLCDGSTGGTDLIALILNKKFPNIKTTQFMMCLDSTVVISSGLVSGNIEILLYSTIALYVLVKVVDVVTEGFNFSKSLIIISNKPDELVDFITKDFSRGLTILNGRGGYTNDQKEVLLVVVAKRQELALKKAIKELDPNAFIIISDAYEVLGEGFKAI